MLPHKWQKRFCEKEGTDFITILYLKQKLQVTNATTAEVETYYAQQK